MVFVFLLQLLALTEELLVCELFRLILRLVFPTTLILGSPLLLSLFPYLHSLQLERRLFPFTKFTKFLIALPKPLMIPQQIYLNGFRPGRVRKYKLLPLAKDIGNGSLKFSPTVLLGKDGSNNLYTNLNGKIINGELFPDPF